MATKRDKIRQGEFYTPKLYVDKAHEYMEEVFGEDWKEKYIVFDPAWGQGNLTKDYKFKELYCSTLLQEDLDIAGHFNPEATKFQFDFLNDPDSKFPEGLLAALRGERDKEVIVLMNPPFGTAANMGTGNDHKAGISKTNIWREMRAQKGWGMATRQLLCQFIYRTSKYDVKGVGLFSNPGFMASSSYQAFRERTIGLWGFKRAFLFPASEFDGASSNWGVSFSAWDLSGEPTGAGPFPHQPLVSFLGANGVEADEQPVKKIYNANGAKTPNQWAKAKKTDRVEVFRLSSYNQPQTDSTPSRMDLKALGSLYSVANDVYHNGTNVALFSWATQPVGSYDIMEENLHKCTALFSARKLIQGNWINDKDEYLIPDETHPKYHQFEIDSLVYSLFNNSSQQSSLRGVEYKQKTWDIKNEFFWVSRSEVKDLFQAFNFSPLLEDLEKAPERYVYSLLHAEDQQLLNQLSPLAREVLEKGTELYIYKTAPFRIEMHASRPDLHLQAWDAGYAQLKEVAKEFLSEDHKEFRELYRAFEEQLRPLVYELGFLLGGPDDY